MIIISRSKKAKKVEKKSERWTDEPRVERRNEYKEPHLCVVDECQNFKMETSNVCSECYQRISNEMAETVKDDDNIPLKLDGNHTYKKFMKLLENEEDEL